MLGTLKGHKVKPCLGPRCAKLSEEKGRARKEGNLQNFFFLPTVPWAVCALVPISEQTFRRKLAVLVPMGLVRYTETPTTSMTTSYLKF